MTLEIDDAGWGDLVGGCFIVVRRVETGEFHAGEIPVELFQQPAFRQKLYLERAWEIVCEGLRMLGADRSEPIRVCTGYVFSTVRRNLPAEGYVFTPVRITGDTQDLVEGMYLQSLRELGITDLSANAGGGRFKPLFEWVSRDLRARERFVKTGWTSWGSKWRERSVNHRAT